MKKCELCDSVAKMYCESDQASLCWDCDSRVHTANFLVAKHSRTLLCHVCQSLTPWTASGPSLGPTVSLCQGCAAINSASIDDDDDDDADRGPGNDGDDDDDSDRDEDDGDNQVVPLANSIPPPPLPSSSSGSSCDESSKGFSNRGFAVFNRRTIGVFFLIPLNES